jgi:Lipid A 3-O-deacylase (PagL)
MQVRILRSALHLVAVLVVTVSSTAMAQAAAPDSLPTQRPVEQGVELWMGRATHSPQLGFLGDTPGVNMALFAARFTRVIASSTQVALEYTADLVPVAVLSPPIPTVEGTRSASARCQNRHCQLTPFQRMFPPGSAFGAGLSPIGLTWVFQPDARVRPTLATTGGLLWTDRRVPTTGATRINFVATGEAGVRAAVSRSYELTATYRFHHLSNAGTARENIALASQLFSLGVRWHAERQR